MSEETRHIEGKGNEVERGHRVWIGWSESEKTWIAIWEFIGQVGEFITR
jgi:hypothetical protein